MGLRDTRLAVPPLPLHAVTLSPYCIDRTEVTIGAYQSCVERGSCSPLSYANSLDLPANPRIPMILVNWEQASAYCVAAAGRLPTEAEWEYAARGADGRVYPWGNQPPSDQLCWNRPLTEPPCEVGSFPAGVSPFGVLDMAGNAEEWVADWFEESYPASAQRDPRGPATGDERIVRGGATAGDPIMMLSARRSPNAPHSILRNRGFRCASDVAQ